MRVRKVVSFQTYWERYPSKRPSLESAIRKRGDNIWHQDASGSWVAASNGLHDERHRERDLRGENVVVASEFYYFGQSAVSVPERFNNIPASTQGHKNTYDGELISKFWDWISNIAPMAGRIDVPSEFTESGCCAQKNDTEKDEDVCEDTA